MLMSYFLENPILVFITIGCLFSLIGTLVLTFLNQLYKKVSFTITPHTALVFCFFCFLLILYSFYRAVTDKDIYWTFGVVLGMIFIVFFANIKVQDVLKRDRLD